VLDDVCVREQSLADFDSWMKTIRKGEKSQNTHDWWNFGYTGLYPKIFIFYDLNSYLIFVFVDDVVFRGRLPGVVVGVLVRNRPRIFAALADHFALLRREVHFGDFLARPCLTFQDAL